MRSEIQWSQDRAMSDETELLRERLQEYRALLQVSFTLLTSEPTSKEARDAYLEKLEEHGIIAKKEIDDGTGTHTGN